MAAPSPAPRTRPTRKAGGRFVISRGASTTQDKDDILQSVQKGEYISNQIADPFQTLRLYDIGTGSLAIMPPPVNVNALLRFPNDNSILRQCIETMVTNIEGHGHRLEYVGPDGKDLSDEAKQEKDDIEEFLSGLHPDLSVMEIRRRLRWDIETLGFAFMEIGRSKEGLPTFISHIPAHTMRATKMEEKKAKVEYDMVRFGKKIKGTVMRQFRRYVQIVGTTKVFFKELGDPRVIDPTTGMENNALKFEESATEIVFIKQYYPGQLYGLPRWFNNLVAIQGSRQAELTNLDFFKDNAIPAMAILVSGGSLSYDTLTQVEDHVTAARGRAAQNRIMVIEVEGDENAASKDGTIPAPKVELKPLAGERPNEGQFLAYDAAQIEKVRSSFRLPPIFTGHAQDYTRASAQTSYEVAEGQVFGPERGYLDDIINRIILKPYGVQFWELRSNPPRISDPQEIIAAVEAFTAVGAMTPNVAIGIANEQFGLDIAPIDDDWGNFPFTIVESLAAAGKLLGFEDILKDIEDTNVDPATGQPIPGGGSGKKPVDLNTEDKKVVNDGTGKPAVSTDLKAGADEDRAAAREVRQALRKLGDVLKLNKDVQQIRRAMGPPTGSRRIRAVREQRAKAA